MATVNATKEVRELLEKYAALQAENAELRDLIKDMGVYFQNQLNGTGLQNRLEQALIRPPEGK